MKYCLANPPAYLFDHTRHFIQAGSRWSFSMDAPKDNHKWPHYQPFPFNLAYAVEILWEAGHEVDAFDGCALDMDEGEWIRRVAASSPDILIVEIPTVSFPLMAMILFDIQSRIGCKVLVTGPHVTAMPKAVGFEILTGEWEATLGEERLFFENYPWPNRKFFPFEQYSNYEFYRPSAQMVSSRGCPCSCSFCVERYVTYKAPKVTARFPDDVVDEMEDLKNQGVKQVWFDDMSITAKRGHVEAICHEILDRRLDLPWTAMADMNVRRPTIQLMKSAGCVGVAFGVETINPAALKRIGKPWVTKERAEEFIKALREEEIYSEATYALGLPGETRDSLMELIDFAVNLPSDALQFSIATPFPGTPFFEECNEKGWLTTYEWTVYDGARYSVTDYPELSSEEIMWAFKYAMDLRKEMGRGFRK